jgi:16S rRNA processing protein RimM
MVDDYDWVVLGQIGKLHGVEGWVRLRSFTEERGAILRHRQFRGEKNGVFSDLEIDAHRNQPNGLVVKFKNFDDPESAIDIVGATLSVQAKQLPALEDEEFYWHQLEGLRVLNLNGEEFGIVKKMLQTGANDVVVVKPVDSSLDRRERLIPWIRGDVIKSIDIEKGELLVSWLSDYLE